MFQDLSLRPKRLKLKETAGVVRYLKAIAVEAEFSPERALVEDISEVLWGTLLNTARIEIAAKTQAIEFLKEHAATYLASFDVEAIVKYLRRREVPMRHEESFRPPKLMGRSRSGSHHGPARLADDVTERIYVAYYALRRTKVRNARGRVAAVLNRFGYKTRAKPGTDTSWTSAEVNERVRQYEARMIRQQRMNKGTRQKSKIEDLRDMQIDGWIHGFHSRLQMKASERDSPG